MSLLSRYMLIKLSAQVAEEKWTELDPPYRGKSVLEPFHVELWETRGFPR